MDSRCFSKHTQKYCFLVVLFIVSTILASAQVAPVQISSKRNTDNSYSFNYKKNRAGTYYVSVKFKNLENALLSSFSGTVDAYVGTLFTIQPIVRSKPVRFESYSISFTKGNPEKTPDESFVYLLPYPKGEERSLFYLSNLREKYFKEKPSTDFKSFAFESNDYDTVCAIRKGIVVEIEDKYDMDTTLYKSYTSYINAIQIEHADGTIASYKGFRKDGIFVREGDVVLPHDRLGVLSKYDARKKHVLRLQIFYTTKKTDEINNQNPDTLIRNRSFETRYIDPFFLSSEGVSRLQNKSKYKSNITESHYTKELNRKELRVFDKNKINLADYLNPVLSLH